MERNGDFTLKLFLKVGEDKVATKHQIKSSIWQLTADVLLSKFYAGLKTRPQAVAAITFFKRSSDPCGGQLPQTSACIAGHQGSAELFAIDVRG